MTGVPLAKEEEEGLPKIANPEDLPDLEENQESGAEEILTGDASYETGDASYETGDALYETGDASAAEPNPYADASESIGGDFSARMKELMREPESGTGADANAPDDLQPGDENVDWLDD